MNSTGLHWVVVLISSLHWYVALIFNAAACLAHTVEAEMVSSQSDDAESTAHVSKDQ